MLEAIFMFLTAFILCTISFVASLILIMIILYFSIGWVVRNLEKLSGEENK